MVVSRVRGPLDESRGEYWERMPVNQIRVDTYQRGVRPTTLKMMGPWDPGLALTLCVNERPEEPGRYYCMDGQHRLYLAQEAGVSYVAVFVYRVPRWREIEYWKAWNIKRKPVTPLDRFWAEVEQGEQRATDVLRIIKHAGFSLARNSLHAGAREIVCIVAVQELYDVKGLDPGHREGLILASALHLWKALWGERPTRPTDNMLRALGRLYRTYGSCVRDERLVRNLKDKDPQSLESEARGQAMRGEGTVASLVRALVVAHNYKTSKQYHLGPLG